MADLSPAAQAVRAAYWSTDTFHSADLALASALRAVADQVLITMTATACIHHLHGVAAELEGTP